MFSKKATKFEKNLHRLFDYVVSVKSMVKISSIVVAFLENMNFTKDAGCPEEVDVFAIGKNRKFNDWFYSGFFSKKGHVNCL